MHERLPNDLSSEILYQRGGTLSQTTQLNEECAQGFMSTADMRHDIRITDSDKKPEYNSFPVSSDTLAARRTEWIKNLNLQFREDPLHTFICDDDGYEIQVHERVIDQKIRDGHYVDRSDYNEQFIKMINQETKRGLSQALFHEKLRLGDERLRTKYLFNALILMVNGYSVAMSPTPEQIAISASLYYLTYNVPLNIAGYFHHKYTQATNQFLGTNIPTPADCRRNISEVFLPNIPVDRWARGKFYLLKHGNNMVIPKEEM